MRIKIYLKMMLPMVTMAVVFICVVGAPLAFSAVLTYKFDQHNAKLEQLARLEPKWDEYCYMSYKCQECGKFLNPRAPHDGHWPNPINRVLCSQCGELKLTRLLQEEAKN